jgi:hypothetical protein
MGNFFDIQNVPEPFVYPQAAQVGQECRYLDKILQELIGLRADIIAGGGGGGSWVKVLGELTQYIVPVGKKLVEIKFFDSINDGVDVAVGTTPGGNDIADETLSQNIYHFVTVNRQWVTEQVIYFSGHSSATESWIKLETLPGV